MQYFSYINSIKKAQKFVNSKMLFFTVIILASSAWANCPRVPEPIKYRHECESEILEIYCDKKEVIFITSAFFGRSNKIICPKQETDDHRLCTVEDAKEIVEKKCNNKEFCKIKVNSYVFGKDKDWKPKTVKHLEVEFKCISTKCGDDEKFDFYAPILEERCPGPNIIDIIPIDDKHIADDKKPKKDDEDKEAPGSDKPEELLKPLTHPACVCLKNYLRDCRSHKCVYKDKCPRFNPDKPLEVEAEHYTNCGDCEECLPDRNIRVGFCTKECKKAGYYCDLGYCRNQESCCVKEDA